MNTKKLNLFTQKLYASIVKEDEKSSQFSELQTECMDILRHLTNSDTPLNELYRILGQFRSKIHLIHKTAMDKKKRDLLSLMLSIR